MAPIRLIATLVLALVPLQAWAGDPVAGERIFRAQCSACHATEPGKIRVGPNLFGIIGRRAGTVEGFKYSAANTKSDIVWNAEVLDKYLVDPRAMIPGTTMTYAGLRNDTQRADVIAYVEALK